MPRAAVYIILWNCFFLSTGSSAQQVSDTIGDIDAPVDITEFYKKLYHYSKDRKLIYLVYRAVFNPPAKPAKKSRKSGTHLYFGIDGAISRSFHRLGISI